VRRPGSGTGTRNGSTRCGRYRVAVTAPDRLPGALRWAARLLAAEALTVAGLVIYLGFETATAGAADLTDAVALIGFAILLAAAAAGLAVALARRKPRARAPAIVLQLLGVVVAYYLATTTVAWLAAPVVAVALLVITLLLVPSTTAALAE
jgi:hypothetical protein